MSALKPGSPLIFMKVGTHANETLDSILERKRKEIEDGGYAMWGYGGNCHPLTVVRPFAEMFANSQEPIRLVMEQMNSRHFAEQIAADQYSIDGSEWVDIDKSVHRVLGSRYALFIKNLSVGDFDLPLSDSKVALGSCEGRRGDEYIKGRVDKACLVYDPQKGDQPIVKRIGLVAEVVYPFAALLRNRFRR